MTKEEKFGMLEAHSEDTHETEQSSVVKYHEVYGWDVGQNNTESAQFILAVY